MSLKRIFRIHLRRDFDKIFKEGKSIHCLEIALRYLTNQTNNPRIAVIVSKKVAKKAVLRNKLRRQIKEIIRPRLETISNLDLVFILKTPVANKSFTELKKIVGSLLDKIR